MFLALTIRFVREPSPSTAALASTMAGLAATIRPTGVALLAVLLAMVFLQWHRLPGSRLVMFAAAIVPSLLLQTGERVAVRAMHGDRPTSLVGRYVFAKASLIDAPSRWPPSPNPLRARLEHHLEVTYAPMRDLIASRAAGSPHDAAWCSTNAASRRNACPNWGHRLPVRRIWR